MPGMNEWTFTAEVAKWIEQILNDRPDLPFSKAQVEVRGTGSRKRRDLTIYDRQGNVSLTGEFKMPDNPDGRTPLHEGLVKDAHEKADAIGAAYFFTCNVNRCVLWQTFEQGKPITERHIAFWDCLAAPIRHADELLHPRAEDQFKRFLEQFLTRSAGIITGAEAMPWQPLDAKFLFIWESALEQPVAQTLRALTDLYEKDKEFTKALDHWMVDQQWVISHRDEEIIRDNLERAAKFSNYMLANRVIFYKALRRRIRGMNPLVIPKALRTGAELRKLLDEYFEHAILKSRNYETVFYRDYGDTLPFLSDHVVDSWCDLVDQTDAFDFTKIDYEIIGAIFERLLSPSERHKFGQHYTMSEVVDLINAFCIRDANAKVMDPACGGGTFLVRAYKRKSDLSGGKIQHQDLLQQLCGLDIAAYPAHLTTVNLATRDLIDDANYPLVARKDFFDSDVNEPIFHIPLGSEGGQMAMLQIGKVDAVVGNPPYIRQEKITEYSGKKYKTQIRKQAERDAPGSDLSGRSDIHCYFFTHAFTFLNEGGYMGLLTSSPWLDTTYGFHLQKFLLDHFEIVAVFESNCEPWFSGARVTTAATILRRQKNPAKRAANNVKFVSLTRPISELLTYARSEEDRRLTFEELRDRIESATGTEEFSVNLNGTETTIIRQESLHGMRLRIVNQGDLGRLGRLSVNLSGDDETTDDEEEQEEGKTEEGKTEEVGADEAHIPARADYTGYKWGILLRAPDVFFKLMRQCGTAFVPLGTPSLALVKRGVTSGCDKFFFAKDITEDALKKTPDRGAFRHQYGVSRVECERTRIVHAGDGSVHLIERKYLEPVVFNLMELDSVAIREDQLAKRLLRVRDRKDALKGTHVIKYIRWGEHEGFDDRETCRNRDPWYCLPIDGHSDVLWSKSHRYRHIAGFNGGRFVCNCNLYDIWGAKGVDTKALAAVLNSTIVGLFKYQFGRMMGGDPMLKTEVFDVKMMLVPDPRAATERIKERLEAALDSLCSREIGHLVAVDSEEDGPTGDLAMKDRQELDDAVLEMLGVSDPAEREALRAELYSEVTKLLRTIRAAEKRMQKHRSATARKGKATPHSIAAEIWEAEIEEKPQVKTPLDFIFTEDVYEQELPEGKATVVNDLFTNCSLRIGGRLISFDHLQQAAFAQAVSKAGVHGLVSIPMDPEVCEQAVKIYEEYESQITARFEELASAYTGDQATQDRIVKELWRFVRNSAGR